MLTRIFSFFPSLLPDNKSLSPKVKIDPAVKYYIHDMHRPEEQIGISNTMDEAIDAVAKDSLTNHGRCYDICEGPCENNKVVWFGDSWKVGQYYREHGNQEKRDEFAMHNAHRIFGEQADITPTRIPETFIVKMR